ncbi:MAG TPA: adenosine deaminase [Chitinophagaceae bacterium]|nr:adenosine deaminase [Chitinophagaceae bacterium]
MNYQALPKIELHLHLDCSLSYKVVQQIDPSISYEAYRDSFVAPPKCTDLMDYLKRAVKGFELMQTKEQLRLVTLDLFDQLKQDNVIYAEIRFAPLLHIAQGLKPEEVVQTVNDAVTEGIAQTGVQARIILCTLRHYFEEQSLETVKLVHQFKGTNVVAFDIAGDEAGFPIDAHLAAFAFARENNIPCTAHAGEAKGAESVWETSGHFHPSRIGHGVRSAEDEKLLEFLKESDIHLEVCPTSNVQTNVVDTIRDHPADKIYFHGVSMSINTDCRTISDVTLSSEFSLMAAIFNWKKEHFLRCSLEAIRHSFCEDSLKEKLRQQLLSFYNKAAA